MTSSTKLMSTFFRVGSFTIAFVLVLHTFPVAAKSHAQTLWPAVFFTDVTSGPQVGGPDNLGVPIAIFGKGFGSTRGNSTVTISGLEVAKYWVWGESNANNTMLDMIVVQPGPNVTAGAVVVNVGGRVSKKTQLAVDDAAREAMEVPT